MTERHRLYNERGQSPWLDNLTRTYLRDGTLARFVDDGIGGVTANPTIFAKAIEGPDAYDEQFAALTAAVLDRLAHVGADMNNVGLTLEDQRVASFHESFAHVLDTLTTKARQLARR